MKKFLLLMAVVAAVACRKIEISDSAGRDYCRIRFNLEGFEETPKSVFAADENTVETLLVWIYDVSTGRLVKSIVFSETSIQDGRMEASVPKLENAAFLFLANMQAMDAPIYLKDALSLRYHLDESRTLKRLFPMSRSMVGRKVMSDTEISFSLQRMVAKYTFRLDKSNLRGTFTLKSVCVKQSAADVGIFTQTAAQSVMDGDAASDSEIALVSVGGPAVLYMLENLRGILSPGNANPWKKIPHKDEDARLSTYIEVHATYVSPTMKSSDMTYRMYLGDNNTSNYDVARNTVHVITLIPSDTGIATGILDAVWKMDPGDYEINGKLSFSKRCAVCAASYDAPYIIRRDGSRVTRISDTVNVIRSSERLTYSLSHDAVSSNVSVGVNGNTITLLPASGREPSGVFALNVRSYDGLLSDNAVVYSGAMDLYIRFNHGTGIIQMWSGDTNPRQIKFKVSMDYEVCSSAWGGSSWFNMREYMDRTSGRREFEIVPGRVPKDLDNGVLCAAIRNLGDGIVPTPDGFTRYTPYFVNVNFDISVAEPAEWRGKTFVRYNPGLFLQPSVGFVANDNYMGFWYVSGLDDGNAVYHRKTSGGETTSPLTVYEFCNGIQLMFPPDYYPSAVFEI